MAEGGSFEARATAPKPSLTGFQTRIAALVREVARADLRNFRTLSGERDWQRIVARATLPIALRLTRDARTLVAEIVAACAEPELAEPRVSSLPPGFLSFERQMDAAADQLAQGRPTLAAVEDIAFLVQMELRQRLERLERLGDAADPVTVIGECDGALRRIRKGLGTIDRGIVEIEGVAPALDFASELQESLTVRRSYGRLRAYFSSQKMLAVSPSTIEANLRAASARIDSLAEGEVAALLRVRDRLQVLELQQRLVAWLAPGSERDPLDGERLLQDVHGFVEMLHMVNRRQELVEHDAAAVERFLSLPPESNERGAILERLSGLDDDLDRAVSQSGEHAAIDGVVAKVGTRLGVRTGGSR